MVSDRDPEELKRFVLVADSIHEASCSNPILSTRAELEAERARLALPAERRARLDEVAAQSCEVAANDGPDPRYLAQDLGGDFLGPTRFKLAHAVLTWAIENEQASAPQRPQARQMMPLPPLVTRPVVEGEGLSLEDPAVQIAGGAAAGAMSGAVPLGSQTVDVAIELRLLPNGTYWARVGRTCGEIVSGVVQIGVGCAGMSAGAGMSGTGGGALVGVPVISGSYAIAVNGCGTLANGLRHAGELWREGAPPEEPAPSSQVILLRPKPKPTAQAPKPAAEPTPSSAAPSGQTTTTIRYKDASGKTIKTVTKSESGTTTTTVAKGKPPKSDATTPSKGAKRGPKTDPDAPHNAAVRKERQKLEAEGYEIVAGGGTRPEKLVKIDGGKKSGRRPDVIGRKPGEPDRGVNVGRTNADGTPVKREAEALEDLNKHSDTPTDFVPYDR